MCMYKQLITLLAASFLASTANAAISQNTVETQEKIYVMDSNGSCVRTMWMMPGDKCEDQEITEEIEMYKVEERIVLFDFDKHDLKHEYVESLNRLIEILNHNQITNIKIVGYTDRIGGDTYNKTLSHKRAEAVNHYLNHHMKLESSIIELRAMGKTNQFASCEGSKGSELISCLMPNRRVEVEIDYNFHDKKTVIIPWRDRMYHPEKYKDVIDE